MEVYTVEEFYCYDPKVCPPPKTKQVWCVNKYGVGRKDIFNHDFDIAWFPLPKVPDYLKQNRVEISNVSLFIYSCDLLDSDASWDAE